MSVKTIAIIRNAQPHDFGGGERFPVFLSEVLKDEGLAPIIISRSQKLRDFAKQHSIETIHGWWWNKQNWSGPWILATPLYVVWQGILFFYYISLFRKIQATTVHIQSKDDFIAATYAAKALRINTVWTDHADLKHIWHNVTVWYKNPIGKMISSAAKRCDTITVVSESELNLILARLPKQSPVRKKLVVVYNGAFDVTNKYPQENHTGTTFLFAGRLVHDKGVRELIEAFNEISAKYSDAKLTIVGDGQNADYFKDLAKGNNKITFHGHQSDPFTYLRKADIFVLPTYHEGFSIALVEASMMKLAIIATDVGGNPEIIKDNKTGILVTAKSASDLANKMELLLNDPQLREQLAKNARQQFIKKFQFNDIVKKEFIPLLKGKE